MSLIRWRVILLFVGRWHRKTSIIHWNDSAEWEKKNNSRLVNHQTVTQPHFLSFANTNETKLAFFTARFSQRFYFLLHFSSAPQNTGRWKQELMFRHHKLAVFFCFFLEQPANKNIFSTFHLLKSTVHIWGWDESRGPVSRYQKPGTTGTRDQKSQRSGTRKPGIQEPKTRNQDSMKQGTILGTRNQVPGTKDQTKSTRVQESRKYGPGIQGPGTRDQEPGTKNQEPEVQEFMNQEPVARSPGTWPQIWIWLGKNFSDLSVQLSRLKGQIGHKDQVFSQVERRRNKDRLFWHCKDRFGAFGTWCTVTSSAQVKFFSRQLLNFQTPPNNVS